MKCVTDVPSAINSIYSLIQATDTYSSILIVAT